MVGPQECDHEYDIFNSMWPKDFFLSHKSYFEDEGVLFFLNFMDVDVYFYYCD